MMTRGFIGSVFLDVLLQLKNNKIKLIATREDKITVIVISILVCVFG